MQSVLTLIKYILLVVLSLVVTVVGYFLMPLIALAVDSSGNLPRYLKWYQTPDAPCWGAPFWAQKNPTYSKYKLCVTWLWRNPAQGFDQFAAAKVDYNTPIKVYGDLSINDQVPVTGGWFFITGRGVFQLACIIPIRLGSAHLATVDIGDGWRLDPIAKGYKTQTLGALIATPLRYHTVS